jgi:hypothetical protein
MEETSKDSVQKEIKPESLSTVRQEIELQTLSLAMHIMSFLFPLSQRKEACSLHVTKVMLKT